MNLQDIIGRECPPEPWREGEKIPWHDPGFSERMLREHLSQSHDAASRRFEIIDSHVRWIHEVVLSGRQSRILDLCCGPGLYLQRLASLGHDCVGIDYSPASIAYAKESAGRAQLKIRYMLEDIRTAEPGTKSDLVVMIWGEFNVFSPADAKALVKKAAGALCDYGQLVLEVHPFDAIRRQGNAASKWGASPSGLFCKSPHICLEESFWDETRRAATTRYFILDPASSSVTAYASSSQAYTDEEFCSLLNACGFTTVTQHPSLTGEDESSGDVMVLRAEKEQAQ
ncbi:MAG: class I SAM-dependent methyltransferase [Planctomycetota bacterium]|nr:class I SAM-dependent methyltransferase [Planctomycetota bacterium]